MTRKRPNETKASVWEKPKIREMLKQPAGSPVKLTRAEAKSIAEASFGARPDLPPGSRYVRDLKHLWRGLTRNRRAKRSA